MKLALTILFSLVTLAQAAVPLPEFPLPSKPITRFVDGNGSVNAYNTWPGLAFFDATGRTNALPLTPPLNYPGGMSGRTVTMLPNSVIVAGYTAFNNGKASNYVAEYRLDFTNGMPSAAAKVFDAWFGHEARWVRSFKTASGGVVVASFSFIGHYNLVVAYRNPAGQWSFTDRKFGDWQNFVPAFDFRIQEGRDGRIYFIFGRDSSHTVSLIRGEEWDGKFIITDFRYDLLTVQCQFVFDRQLCRDGVMAPDYENPWLETAVTDDGRILISYQGADGAIGCASCECWFRLCKPVITALDTFPQPKDGHIYQWRKDYSIVHVWYHSQPGVPYVLQLTTDGINWRDLQNLDNIQVENVATGNVSYIRAFHGAYNADTFLLRAVALSYWKSLVDQLQNNVERVQTRVPMWPDATGLNYSVKPMLSTNPCVEVELMKRFSGGVHTDLPHDGTLTAWSDEWIVVTKTNGTTVAKRL